MTWLMPMYKAHEYTVYVLYVLSVRGGGKKTIVPDKTLGLGAQVISNAGTLTHIKSELKGNGNKIFYRLIWKRLQNNI